MNITQSTLSSPQLPIVYEDQYVVIVNKPAGLLVHKSNIDKHETEFLLQKLRKQLGTFVFPVHRLDKPTSGVILFAKSAEAAALIKLQMEGNIATKEYLLICRGYCPPGGVIDHPLKPINDFKSKRKGQCDDKPAQLAITEFTRLATVEIDAAIDRYPASRFSLVKARLLTGRKHQIRRHFKHLSHPIIGCPKYGKSNYNHYFAQQLKAPGLLLHALSLEFIHPAKNTPVHASALPSAHFLQVIKQFGWLDSLHQATCLTAG